MTEQTRSLDEISRSFYDAAIKLRVAQLKEENPKLTKEQATALAFKQIPEAYDALQKKPAQ